MKLYLSGFFFHDVWIDAEREIVVGIFSSMEAAKRAAEEAVRKHGRGLPFVREYVLDTAAPEKWEGEPEWLGERVKEVRK